MNPADDTFLSVAKNAELKVFDLCSEFSSPEAELTLNEPNYSLAANFDITGVVLAVSVYKHPSSSDNTNTNPTSNNNNTSTTSTTNNNNSGKPLNRIDLYDVKKLQDAECRFASWRLDHLPEILQLKFSNSESYLLLATAENKVVVLDAFKGELVAEFGGFVSVGRLLIEASFTPDSRFVVGGSDDGTVFVWDVEKRMEVARLEGHVKPSRHVKFSPTHAMMASACQNVLFWIPKFVE